MAHIAAHFSFGGVSPAWKIVSAGAFGLALGVPIGKAECCPVIALAPQHYRVGRHSRCIQLE
jgi:hypothetical protein